MDFLMYAFMVGFIIWGVTKMLKLGEWKAPLIKKRPVKDWDVKFMIDLEQWKKDRGSGV